MYPAPATPSRRAGLCHLRACNVCDVHAPCQTPTTIDDNDDDDDDDDEDEEVEEEDDGDGDD